MLSYFLDRSNPSHYWRWIKWSWVLAIASGLPLMMWNIGGDYIVLLVFGVLLLPAIAHAYGFVMNIKALRTWDEPGRTGPALVTASYLFCGVVSWFFIEFELAFTLGFAAVMMAVMLFGIVFTGLTPLLGMWLVSLLLSPEVTKRGFVFAFLAMSASWGLAIITGYLLGRA